MDYIEAATVMSALRDGIDPSTGENLPSDHVLQTSRVIRALFLSVETLERSAAAIARKAMIPTKTGSAWSEAEDKELISAFESGQPLSMLAKLHERTTGAITARLEKLGKLDQGSFRR